MVEISRTGNQKQIQRGFGFPVVVLLFVSLVSAACQAVLSVGHPTH